MDWDERFLRAVATHLASEWSYLLRKHKGGVSGRLGGTYEEHYAACLTAYHGSIAPDLRRVFVGLQAAGFVDDVAAYDGHRWTFYQLKNQKKVSWIGDSRPLERDFYHQAQISSRVTRRKFQTTLVVSRASLVAHLLSKVPPTISKHTSVEFFPAHHSCESFVQNESNLNGVFYGVIAPAPGDTTPTRERVVAAMTLLAASCRESPQLTSVARRFAYVASFGLPMVAGGNSSRHWRRAEAVLAKVYGLAYFQSSSGFYWQRLDVIEHQHLDAQTMRKLAAIDNPSGHISIEDFEKVFI